MRLTMTLTITCLFVFCLAGLPWEQPVRAVRLVEQPNPSSVVRARAIVSGPNGARARCNFSKGLVLVVQHRRREHRQSISETF